MRSVSALDNDIQLALLAYRPRRGGERAHQPKCGAHHHVCISPTPRYTGLLIVTPSVALREAAIGRGGILPGKELAFTFGTPRANHLIWRYVIDKVI